MKKIFRMFAVCALAGVPLLYTGCTDFSEDINAVNERIDKLVSGDVATIQTQISNLQSTVTSLESAKTEAASAIEKLQGQTASLESSVATLTSTVSGLETNLATLNTKLQSVESAIAGLQGETSDLKTQLADAKTEILAKIATIEGQIALINSEIDAAKQNIEANKTAIAALEGKVATIEQTVASIQATVAALETNKADISWVEATFATLEQMKAANELIVALRVDMTAVQERIALVEGRLSGVEERLQKIDAYHVEVSSKLAELESLVASNGAAIVGLGTLIDNAMGLISDNQKSINDLKAELASLKEYCAQMDAVIEDIALTLANVQKTANSALDLAQTNKDEITVIHAALDNMYTAQEVDEKIAILKAMLSNEIAMNKAALEQYKQATDGIIKNLEAACGSNSERIDAVKKEINSLSAYWQEKISELNGTLSTLTAELTSLKKNVDSINEALTERINTLEGDYKAADQNLQKQINDILEVLKSTDDQYKNAIEEMRQTYGAAIGSLSTRIQSIAYVPEYAEGAYAQTVKLNGKIVSERSEITFKVTPSKYLDKVNFSTTTLLVTPQLKSATYNENELPLDFEYDKEKGLVTVRIPANLDKKAVAICVKNGEETGSNLTSDFAKVSARAEFEILDNYVLYNGTKEYAAKTEEFGWDKWTSVNPFAGYTPHIKYESKYYTIAEAKDLFLIEDIKTIEPVAQAPVVLYTPNNDTKVKNALTVTGVNTDEIAIAKKDGVTEADLIYCAQKKAQVVVKTAYKLGNIAIAALAKGYTCKIVNRQINWTLAANGKTSKTRTDWSYDFAVKQSSDKTAATYLNKDYLYDECEFIEATADYKEFQNVIKTLAAAGKVQLLVNDKPAAEGQKMTVTYKAGVLHQVADVTLSKGLYGFGAIEVKNVYTNKYTDDANATDYNVKFTAEFGKAPQSKKIVLNEGKLYDLTYSSEGYSPLDLKDAPMSLLYAEAGNGFADKATFYKAVFENTQVPSGYVYNIVNGKEVKVKDVTPEYTYINVSAGSEFVESKALASREGQGLRVSTNADMADVKNKFAFETKYATWWGPVYTFEADAQIVLPDYKLETVDSWVNADNVVKVDGHLADDKWVINDAKLNTYVSVVNSGTKTSDELRVVYEVIEPMDAAKKGMLNFPAAPVYSAVDLADNSLTERILTWGNYTATAVDVKVSLVIVDVTKTKTIVLDDLTLTLKTDDMVYMEDSQEVIVERASQKEVFGNFWEGLRIYGKDTKFGAGVDFDDKGEKINFAWVNPANKKEGRFRNKPKAKYGLGTDNEGKIKFENLKIYGAEGVELPNFSPDNYTFDAATGVVTLHSNEATLLYDLTFEVDAVLTYDRDYNHKNQIVKKVRITFKAVK